MTYLTMKTCNEVREQMPTFVAILASYDIKIIEQWENEQAGTIELTTDANGFPNVRSAKAVAYDCFGDLLLTFKSA